MIVLPTTTIVLNDFYEALKQAKFELLTHEGVRLTKILDDESYETLVSKYGKDVADGTMCLIRGQHNFILARKINTVSSEEIPPKNASCFFNEKDYVTTDDKIRQFKSKVILPYGFNITGDVTGPPPRNITAEDEEQKITELIQQAVSAGLEVSPRIIRYICQHTIFLGAPKEELEIRRAMSESLIERAVSLPNAGAQTLQERLIAPVEGLYRWQEASERSL